MLLPAELARRVEAREAALKQMRAQVAAMKADNYRVQMDCERVLKAHPHLARRVSFCPLAVNIWF